MPNLMDEKLVWMTASDHAQLVLAANIAQNILSLCDETELPTLKVSDLDGRPIDLEDIERWRNLIDAAMDAAGRTKYVPEDTLPKLRLVLMSD